MHRRCPPILELTYHFHKEHSILFGDNRDVKSVVRYNEEVSNKFLPWFHANHQYEEGRDHTYAEFSMRFICM